MERGAQLYQIIRGRLYKALPMLALPLGLLDWRTSESALPGTDGRYFYAPPAWLEAHVKTFGAGEELLLHSVLHAMLGHLWGRGGRDAARWDLACDMAAVFLQSRLLGKTLEPELARAYYALRTDTVFSASAIYAQLTEQFPIDLSHLRSLFARDSHSFWQIAVLLQQARSSGGEDGGDLAALWKRQAGKLQPYMRSDRPKIGAGTGSQRLQLQSLPENHTQFAALLRAFSVVCENRHVNDADFSYAWYAYGMAHYDAMPLIEPLEYSEERKLRELVIVLDTSASCSRGLTVHFLSAVHDILLREHLFFERFHLHILQCDCEVQQDAVVTTLDEFQWYLEHLELYGGGGTDFRPAFAHIDRLVAQGELPQLGGVLYFTDGYGVFPASAPEYPVTFVMLQYRYDDIDLPRWAGKLILDAEKPGRDEQWI